MYIKIFRSFLSPVFLCQRLTRCSSVDGPPYNMMQIKDISYLKSLSSLVDRLVLSKRDSFLNDDKYFYHGKCNLFGMKKAIITVEN